MPSSQGCQHGWGHYKKIEAVIRDVLSRGEESLPDDFRAVRALIFGRIARARRELTSRGGLGARR